MKGLNYWQLLAGITVFIFSMSLMEDSLKNISGRAFKKFLQRQTASRFRALLGGTIVAAALQSSSLEMLMWESQSQRSAMAVANGASVYKILRTFGQCRKL
jgi:phosphate:Na+ symporter